MHSSWENLAVTHIHVALYVPPNSGQRIHHDRPYHGLVLNRSSSVRDYIFDDGFVLHTEGHSLFYLPKGSSYHVETICSGGCFAINFDAELSDKPFSVSFRNAESLLQTFKAACDAWKAGEPYAKVLAMRAVYDAVYRAKQETQKQYVSASQRSLLAPAIAEIENGKEHSIAHLAELCGISQVYFRKLFLNFYGVSPKEYLIQKRMAYAKALLAEGLSVSEVGVLCNYSEPCHFSREFTKRVGVAPSRYLTLEK